MDEPVQAYIQLRRPSDGATSEPRHFQYLPLDSGSTVEASFSCNPHYLKKKIKPDFQLYTQILALDAAVLARQMFRAADSNKDLNPDLSNASVQCENGDFPTSVTFSNSSEKYSDNPKEPVSVKKHVGQSNSCSDSKVDIYHAVPAIIDPDIPPPIPEKGAGFAKMKGKLNSKEMDRPVDNHRASISTILTESDPRFSLASSEDLNSRLSAAFSDYSDVTDIHSIYSEVDISDVLSLISSTHTLNDRLSQFNDDSDAESTDSEQTVIGGSNWETSSIDTIEKQLEMLQSMSVEPDCNTYSSFQMAMKYPFPGWPTRDLTQNLSQDLTQDLTQDQTQYQTQHQTQHQAQSLKQIENDLVYDDPSEDSYKLGYEYPMNTNPIVPPRIESMTSKIPPLPPRRFKKLNQPLPNPPNKDLGLKNALQAIKQSFKKTKPPTGRNVEVSSSLSSSDTKSLLEPEVDESPPAIPIHVNDPIDHLTEAENYALYMTLAPLATTSEFDENETMSILYADLNSTREAARMLDKKSNQSLNIQ